MRYLIPVYLTCLACICYGLWMHDWRTILAGCLVSSIWPLISVEVEERHERRRLDCLWDDDDLSDSA